MERGFGAGPCNSGQLLRLWHGRSMGSGILVVLEGSQATRRGSHRQRDLWVTCRKVLVLTLYFVVLGHFSLMAGNLLLPGESWGKGFGVCAQTVMSPLESLPWMILSCIGSMAGVKARASPAPPCLHQGGIPPRAQTMLPLDKDHPRGPGMPPSPSAPAPQPPGIAAHLWHLSLQAPARKRKAEVGGRVPAQPCLSLLWAAQ